MKVTVACGALLVLAAVAAAAPAPKETAADKLQGTWVVVASEDGGEKQKGQVGEKVVIAGDRITLHWGKKSATVRFRLDPSRTPGWIDLVNEQQEPSPGIYELNGDTLKICHPEGGKVRSDKFESRKDSPNDRPLILKRVK